jgi:hypothetical protein
VVALVAVATAAVALGQARDAKARADRALAGTGTAPDTGGQPGPPPPVAGNTTPAGRPGPSPTPGQIDPRADFTVVYQQQELQLPNPGSYNSVYVDLDEPRVGVRNNYDITLTGSGDRMYFQLPDDVMSSSVGVPSVTPKECAEKIRTAPLADDATVPPKAGVVLCIATSLDDAAKQGITRKMVVLQVRAVGADGTVNILVSAWAIPQ